MVPSIVRRHAARVVWLGLVVPALAAGCSNAAAEESAAPAPAASSPAGTMISPASLPAGRPLPTPGEKPVVTITGRITSGNNGDALVLDRPTIERLGIWQVRLYEPWTKQTTDFRGVWLQDLVTAAGARPEATWLHIVGLDDYAVDISLADVRRGGIMLATRAGDGTALPIDGGGPTRIVFLDGVESGANPDQWVWSIKSIDVI